MVEFSGIDNDRNLSAGPNTTNFLAPVDGKAHHDLAPEMPCSGLVSRRQETIFQNWCNVLLEGPMVERRLPERVLGAELLMQRGIVDKVGHVSLDHTDAHNADTFACDISPQSAEFEPGLRSLCEHGSHDHLLVNPETSITDLRLEFEHGDEIRHGDKTVLPHAEPILVVPEDFGHEVADQLEAGPAFPRTVGLLLFVHSLALSLLEFAGLSSDLRRNQFSFERFYEDHCTAVEPELLSLGDNGLADTGILFVGRGAKLMAAFAPCCLRPGLALVLALALTLALITAFASVPVEVNTASDVGEGIGFSIRCLLGEPVLERVCFRPAAVGDNTRAGERLLRIGR